YDVVSDHWPTNSLELKLADRLKRDSFLNGLPNSWADEDLAGLGFIAKTRRNVRDGPDRCVIPATLKSNRPQRCKPMLDADPKTNDMAEQTPFLHQSFDSDAHIERHQDGLQRRILDWDRIVENDHHAVAGKSLKRAAVLEDDLAYSFMVVAQ